MGERPILDNAFVGALDFRLVLRAASHMPMALEQSVARTVPLYAMYNTPRFERFCWR